MKAQRRRKAVGGREGGKQVAAAAAPTSGQARTRPRRRPRTSAFHGAGRAQSVAADKAGTQDELKQDDRRFRRRPRQHRLMVRPGRTPGALSGVRFARDSRSIPSCRGLTGPTAMTDATGFGGTLLRGNLAEIRVQVTRWRGACAAGSGRALVLPCWRGAGAGGDVPGLGACSPTGATWPSSAAPFSSRTSTTGTLSRRDAGDHPDRAVGHGAAVGAGFRSRCCASSNVARNGSFSRCGA